MFTAGMTTLIISNGEMKGIIKIIKSLEEFGLLINSVSKAIGNNVKEKKKVDFLACYLVDSLLVYWEIC